MVDGKLVYSGTEGTIDLEKKTPTDLQSMFRIASMTKSFTAMAILKLRDEGKLTLDDPVSLYIPEIKNQCLTNYSPDITLRNLLTHSAGLPLDNAWGDRQLNMSKPDFVAFLKQGLSFSNTPGFGSNWVIMPDYGIGVILFANGTYAPAGEVNLQVLDELIKGAYLKPRTLQPTLLLKDRQAGLVKLLQDWNASDAIGLVADNFFLDSSLDARKKESEALFKKSGKIIRTHAIIPESQLSGYFIMEGVKADLKISFMLTPQNPALIQEIRMEILDKEEK